MRWENNDPFDCLLWKYGDSTGCWGELQHLLPNPYVLVAISKGMWAVKLCTNKILQFLTGCAV